MEILTNARKKNYLKNCTVVQWRHLVAVTIDCYQKKHQNFGLVGRTAPHVVTGNTLRCVPETRGAETATGA